MIRSIIIDDEENACKGLEMLLRDYCPEVNLVSTANSVEQGVIEINKFLPELVFLDIEMPGENGFKLFERITNPDFEVIFTTAYNKYAIEAFDHNAIHYLLKPIDYKKLQDAILRVNEKRKITLNLKQIDILLSSLKTKNGEYDKIAFQSQTEARLISPNDIVFCKAENNYTEIHLINKEKFIVTKNLGNIEKTLPESTFLRVHKSFLVNMSHVVLYKKEIDRLEMVNGTSVDVSSREKQKLMEFIRKK